MKKRITSSIIGALIMGGYILYFGITRNNASITPDDSILCWYIIGFTLIAGVMGLIVGALMHMYESRRTGKQPSQDEGKN